MPPDIHIPSDQLERFLADGLPVGEESALTGHLHGCPECRRDLEQAAGDPLWWSDARRFLGTAPSAPSAAGTAHSQCADPLADDADSDFVLDFLGPTDDPAMLGRVGPYEIAGVIGRGGTGIVFKAFERALNRFVAVKVLAPHLAASAASRKRFAREAQAAAAVVHEHIVPIYAVDEHRGLPYMVMRYVPGRSLQERLDKQGTLGLIEVLRIGMQTASGLAAAHAQGLVHRDIKPANILLEHGIERVLLTDFGLARAVDDASLTCSGMVAGTPQYMAPEQARGESIDHRTDLFGLGSVLYAMCAGRSPFRAETTMGVLHRICTDRPRPLRQINPEIPEWLERIVRRLHEKSPAKRYQSAAEVADILATHLARVQRSGAALHDPWWQRSLHRIADRVVGRVSKRAMALVGALSMLLAAAVWLATHRHPETTSPTSDAQPFTPAVQAVAAQDANPSASAEAAADASGLGWQPRAQDFDDLRQRMDRAERGMFARDPPPTDNWSSTLSELRRRLDRLELEIPEAARQSSPDVPP